MKKKITVVWVSMLISGLIPGVATARQVACVGDSLTYGFGLPNRESNCYPAQLEKILRQFDPDWRTQNFGHSGATLLRNKSASYVTKTAYSLALASEPEIVIIELGGNDVKRATSSEIERDFIPDYLALIDAFAQLPSHPKIFVCYLPPIYPNNFGYSDSKLTNQINPRILQLPTHRAVEIIDLRTPLENSAHLYQTDGLHPNTEGTRIIAETVAQAILGSNLSPDFDGDEIVDIEDLTMLIEHWGQDEPSVDIVADGIIDVEDLKILMSYWQQEILPFELIGYWKLDEEEGDVAYNSISENQGILIGDPSWQPDSGQTVGALEFDGIDDCVVTDFVLNPASGPFSVLAWIRGGVSGQAILSQADGVNWLHTDSVDGCLMTDVKSPGRSGTGPLMSSAIVTDGQWHRIGIVWDGHYRYLYVDGAEVAGDAVSLSSLEAAFGGLYFGADSTLAPGTFFSGMIDDVRIYNRAVSP